MITLPFMSVMNTADAILPYDRGRSLPPNELRNEMGNAGSEQACDKAVLIARAASQWADGVGGAAALSPAGLGFLQSSGSDSLRFELGRRGVAAEK